MGIRTGIGRDGQSRTSSGRVDELLRVSDMARVPKQPVVEALANINRLGFWSQDVPIAQFGKFTITLAPCKPPRYQ